MGKFLFILNKNRVSAFRDAKSLQQPLLYEGRESMPCDTNEQLSEFTRYMVDNYGDEKESSFTFLCVDNTRHSVPLAASQIENTACSALAIYTMPAVLPILCRKMEVTSKEPCVLFDDNAWIIKKGKVEACSPSGRMPYRLDEGNLARIYFLPERNIAVGEKSDDKKVPQKTVIKKDPMQIACEKSRMSE